MENQAKYAEIARILRKQKVPVFLPGKEEYEKTVATGNLLYRFTQPGLVAQPETVGEVEAIVRIGLEKEVRITIKGGGHSYAGSWTTDEGILLDLKRMKEVKIEYNDQKVPVSVTIQAGAVWGDVYRALVRGKLNGYAINGGRCPSVGVSGFLLGGGLGPFTRSVGMGSDTLLEATIVTVKGNDREGAPEGQRKGDDVRRVTVTKGDEADSDNERLFWALRGGGGGSFGVVVEFKMQVKKLQKETVVAGRYTWFPLKVDDGLTPYMKEEALTLKRKKLMSTMEAFYKAPWDERLTIDSNWMREIKDGKDSLGLRFTVYFDGIKEDFDEAINRHIKNAELAEELKLRCEAEGSDLFFHESLALMWEEEARNALPKPADNVYQLFNSFVFSKDAPFNDIVKIVQTKQDAFAQRFTTDTCSLLATFIHAGGAAEDKRSQNKSAYYWRNGAFHLYLTFLWKDKWVGCKAREFLKELKALLKPFSLEAKAAFVNFADATLEGTEHEEAYYGANSVELRRVKEIWDKKNFFKGKQGIGLPLPENVAPANPGRAPYEQAGRGGYSSDGKSYLDLTKYAPTPGIDLRPDMGGTPGPFSNIPWDPTDSDLVARMPWRMPDRRSPFTIAANYWGSFVPPETDYVTMY